MKAIRKELEDNFDKINEYTSDIFNYKNIYLRGYVNSEHERFYILKYNDNYIEYKLYNPKTWWIKRIIKRLMKKYK